MAAFRLARKMGASDIEFDLQFSKDRHIVVCHDRTLDRYGYPDRRVADLTLSELSRLDMGSWFSPFQYGGERMVSFEDLLSNFATQLTYHAEIKEPAPGLGAAILDMLDKHRVQDQTIVTSFHFDALIEVKTMAPGQRVGWLVRTGGFNADNMVKAAKAGFHQLCPMAGETTTDLVRDGHAQIAEVRAHSVKGVSDMMRVIETGCDGMTINWPDWLVHTSDR